MFRLFLAILAYVWGVFLASDNNGDDGNDNGNDKSKPEAKWTDPDVNKMKGDARKEGRATGEKNILEALGFESVEEAKQRFATFKEWEEDEKTELDKAADCIDKTTKRAEKAEARVLELENEVKKTRTNEAISNALDAADFNGKRSHALRAVDRSQVKEEDGSFDASEAVKALSEDGFPGFEEPPPDLNDPPVLNRQRRKGNDDGKSAYQPNYSVSGQSK